MAPDLLFCPQCRLHSTSNCAMKLAPDFSSLLLPFLNRSSRENGCEGRSYSPVSTVLTECKCEILPEPTISRFPSTAPEIFHIFSILGGKPDTSSVPVDGFDVWDTISIGKPSPRTEILLNIDLAPEEQLYNEMEYDDPLYQGAAIRVGDMKLLMSCSNSTWFKPPELGDISTKDTVSKIIKV